MISVPKEKGWFDVALFETERILGLRTTLKLRTGRPFDPTGERLKRWTDSRRAYYLEPHDGQTRLMVRARGTGQPRLVTDPASGLFCEPVHWITQARQVANLRRRAEQPA